MKIYWKPVYTFVYRFYLLMVFHNSLVSMSLIHRVILLYQNIQFMIDFLILMGNDHTIWHCIKVGIFLFDFKETIIRIHWSIIFYIDRHIIIFFQKKKFLSYDYLFPVTLIPNKYIWNVRWPGKSIAKTNHNLKECIYKYLYVLITSCDMLGKYR